MNDPDVLSEGRKVAVSCPLTEILTGPPVLSPGVCRKLENAGCPLAEETHKNVRFETLLVELSSRFVDVLDADFDAHIEFGLRRIVEMLGVDRSGLGQLVRGEDLIQITHSYQVPGVPPTPKVIVESHFPTYAKKIREGEPFRLPDDLPADATLEREYLTHSGLKSQLTIPLKSNGSVVGGIGFASFRSRVEWPDDLVRRLRLFADIFTNALVRKQSGEAMRKLASKLISAQEEERRLLAREMHDDWTQRLAVLGLDVATLERSIADPSVAAPLLRTIQESLISLSSDVHDLSRQLHPAILNDLGLVEAIRSECAAFTRREGITVDYLAGEIPNSVANDVGLCIYRITQEALRNLAKYAAVSKCRVTLVTRDKKLELTVRDEGIGFDPMQLPRQAGIGLASMKERVSLVRANLTITSALGKGTTVVVTASFEEDNS